MNVLNDAFTKPEIEYAILLEDDLMPSPDFFVYFQQLASLLNEVFL